MGRTVSLQEARATISAKEMVEEYFFSRQTYPPAFLKLNLTHWNQFAILDTLLFDAAKETGATEQELLGFHVANYYAKSSFGQFY